jgi:uncharacterized protein
MGMNRTCKAAVAALVFAVSFAASVAAEPFTDAANALHEHDYATALQLMRPPAEQGNADAQSILGGMYAYGWGVPQDYATAVSWYRKAAEQGDAGCQFDLGVMYDKGQGVLQDYVLAHMWFNLAAVQRPPDCCSSVGRRDGQTFLERMASEMAEGAAAARDIVAEKMTRAQIAEAQKLAREWKPR